MNSVSLFLTWVTRVVSHEVVEVRIDGYNGYSVLKEVQTNMSHMGHFMLRKISRKLQKLKGHTRRVLDDSAHDNSLMCA